MVKSTAIEVTKIKQLAADIRDYPAKIDSTELAKNARRLLKKYAVLSEKIERNVVIRATFVKDLAKIRTEDFKAVRRTLKEKANSILHANNKNTKSEKPAKKAVKKPAPKKSAKTADVKATKKSDPKQTVKKTSPKPSKTAAPKEGT
jgi:hypothetical protein